MSIPIGEKVKYFRKKAGKTQLELEVAMNSSVGSISKLESGKVNPTKETIMKIAELLSLTSSEVTYLLGIRDNEVDTKDISRIKKDLENFFENTDTLSYLLDNRDRFQYFSKYFRRLLAKGGVDVDMMIGTTVDEILFNPKYNFIPLIPEDIFEEFVVTLFARWLKDREYYLGEDWMTQRIAYLSGFPKYEKLWKRSLSKTVDTYEEASRTVIFLIQGQRFVFTYAPISMVGDERFRIIEFKLKDKDINLQDLLDEGSSSR